VCARSVEQSPIRGEGAQVLNSYIEYELDALASKGFRYLTKTYLPRKLKEEDWLD